MPVSQLFAEGEERRDCSFVKAGTGVRIERRGTKAGHQFDAAARHGPEELIEAPMRYLSIIIYPRRN